jgi:hypothetical protein
MTWGSGEGIIRQPHKMFNSLRNSLLHTDASEDCTHCCFVLNGVWKAREMEISGIESSHVGTG